MLLLDTNVWLALAFRIHVHHVVAKSWYEESDDTCCFCRLTQQGFLRLASNPAVFKQEAVSLQQAWSMYDALMDDPRVAFAEEPSEIDSHWRSFTKRRSFSPKVWSDAYLAAFARAGDLELITLDQGFKQYRNLKYTILG